VKRLPVFLLFVLPTLCCHKEADERTETKARVSVTVAEVRVGNLVALVRATGTVDPAPDADWMVTAPQDARIVSLPFAAGDRVRSGAILARFDVPSLRTELATRASELAQAQARLESARQAHTRLEHLQERGVAAAREVEDARKELSDAEAALEQATQTRAAASDLSQRATAVAPFAGLVAERWHNPGDVVNANEHVLRLVDPARLEVTARVLVADTPHVATGHAARVWMPGGEGAGLPAVVASLPGAADPATGTAAVRLRLSAFVPVGAVVQVAIEGETAKDAVIVPAAAVLRQGDEPSVFVVGADGIAHRRPVTLGLESNEDVQILKGVKSGEKVVVKGQDELPDGAAVAVAAE
jgi:RND family efflux transporter MFP subunit